MRAMAVGAIAAALFLAPGHHACAPAIQKAPSESVARYACRHIGGWWHATGGCVGWSPLTLAEAEACVDDVQHVFPAVSLSTARYRCHRHYTTAG